MRAVRRKGKGSRGGDEESEERRRESRARVEKGEKEKVRGSVGV